MSIAILKTGGTIESQITNSTISTVNDNSIISENIKNTDNIQIYSIMNKLSENMKPSDWVKISKSIKNKINNNYNKIIVTHGTDTMMYTASFVEILFGNLNNVKIIFTGAMNGINSKNSDVNIALKSSLEAIKNKNLSDGVYINLRSPNSVNKMYIHQPTKVKLPKMDDKGYTSLYNDKIGVYNNSWSWCNIQYDYTLSKNKFELPAKESIQNIQNKIRFQNIYPGITLNTDDNTEYVILSAYHSGTASFESYKYSLMKELKNNSVKIILCGFSSKLTSNIYDSTSELIENGIRLIKDVQPHVVYVYFCIGLVQEENSKIYLH